MQRSRQIHGQCPGIASGRMRVGGELMASRSAIDALEARLAQPGALDDAGAIGRAVDEIFARGGGVVEGVRSLTSFRDAIVLAAQKRP